MNKRFPRILIRAILFSLISGSVVVIIGLMLGWNTSRQFSDGFFWAGALMIFIGLISFQGYSRGANEGPADYTDPADRSNLGAADISRGKNLMIFFGITGMLLMGLAFLVGRLF